MKSFLVVLIFLSTAVSFAQTTEDFETETNGSTTFSDNGQTFNITSQVGGPFKINALSPGTGWNGIAADGRYIDNNGSVNGLPVQFIINSGTPFIVKNFWLYLTDNFFNLNATGSVTITGKLADDTVYSVTQSSGFNTTTAVNKGFSLIDLSTFGSQNNSNKIVDQIIITSGGNFYYVALDAFNWSGTKSSEDFETESNGSTTFSDIDQTFNITSQAGGFFQINANSPGTGWNGTGADSRYIDNNRTATSSEHVQFTINSGTPFIVNNFWLYLADNFFNLNAIGSVTITGKLAGDTVYTVTQSSGFNTAVAVNKGFSLIDLSTFGSANNSIKEVDQIIITTGGKFFYVALDAFNWTRTFPIFNSNEDFETETNGSTSFSDNGQTFSITSQGSAPFIINSFAIKSGWNGHAADNRIVASDLIGSPAEFAISSRDPFIVNNFWLYLVADSVNFGSVTITGKLGGATVYTVIQKNGFNFIKEVDNGFSYINLSTFGSQNNSNQVVDQIIITTGGSIIYVAMDAFNWSKVVPEINIQGMNHITINDGAPSNPYTTDFSFNAVRCQSVNVLTFTIQNTGTRNLTISSVNITGTDATDYSIITAPAATVAANSSTTFRVGFKPTEVGVRNATVKIESNDSDEAIYDFAISGTGVEDAIPPFTRILADVTGKCSVTPFTPTTSDNCGGTVSVTTTTKFPITTQGTTVVTWIYKDGNGNISTATQKVILNDIIAPVVSDCPGNISINANHIGCSGIATWTAPSAIDNCADSVIVISTHNPGDVFPLGETTVTYTFNDGHGNTSNCSFTVTVTNNMSSSALINDALCNGTATGKVNLTVTGGNSSYTYDWNSGTFNTEDLTNVKAGTYRILATDVNGCTATDSFTVSQPAALDVNTSISSSTIAANNITPGVTYKWFNCATNTLISNETNQRYPVTANGNYAVIITEGECSDTSACVPVFILGENESLNEDLFKIYPNPNTGSFTLFNTIDVDVKITDALSKVVYNNHFDKGQQHIDLKPDMGFYFIHYTHNGQTFTRKMVINQ